jgi:intracellular multiplication protein IcmW
MPDLSHEASSQYWFEYTDPIIYRVITFMESVEDWTLDGDPAMEESLKTLGKELDNIENIDWSTVGQEAAFVQIAANIKTGRGLRLLQAIDVVHPGSASRVLVHAEENNTGGSDPAGFFLKRNIVFERLRLLSRVFSENRLRMISRALEGDE